MSIKLGNPSKVWIFVSVSRNPVKTNEWLKVFMFIYILNPLETSISSLNLVIQSTMNVYETMAFQSY